MSIISTVTNKGEMRWKTSSCALNAKIPIGFVERLARQQKSKVFLTLENLRIHHSKLVKRWLAEDTDRIENFYPPWRFAGVESG